MFDEVAAGYDRTNTILSVGNDRLWRRATTRALSPRPGQRILDLAAGTGTSSVAIARTGADVVAADFSPGMIAEGRRRHAGVSGVSFVKQTQRHCRSRTKSSPPSRSRSDFGTSRMPTPACAKCCG